VAAEEGQKHRHGLKQQQQQQQDCVGAVLGHETCEASFAHISEGLLYASLAASAVGCLSAAGWVRAFTRAELEFGDSEELLTKLDELIEAAPEAEDSDEDSDEESD